MKNHIHKLIKQGEHQCLDFKFEIADSKKIARTLVAFANTDGGKLLVGVKDNGSIAGVRSEEEFYMVEGAASMYCKPEVSFTTKECNIEGKIILEIDVPKSKLKPHSAPYKDDLWKVYIRVDDQNLLANKILLMVWERKKRGKGTFVRYRDEEALLLKLFRSEGRQSLNQIVKEIGISRKKAEQILVNFIMLGIIEMDITEKQSYYRLTPEQ